MIKFASNEQLPVPRHFSTALIPLQNYDLSLAATRHDKQSGSDFILLLLVDDQIASRIEV